MNLKTIEQKDGSVYNYLEVDCNYKDHASKFPISGNIKHVRFFYKKGIPLKLESFSVDGKSLDWEQVHYSTLDWQYTIIGVIDWLTDIEFKEGQVLEVKQFNDPNCTLPDGIQLNWDKYRNCVEKIQLFYENSES